MEHTRDSIDYQNEINSASLLLQNFKCASSLYYYWKNYQKLNIPYHPQEVDNQIEQVVEILVIAIREIEPYVNKWMIEFNNQPLKPGKTSINSKFKPIFVKIIRDTYQSIHQIKLQLGLNAMEQVAMMNAHFFYKHKISQDKFKHCKRIAQRYYRNLKNQQSFK